MSNTKLNIEKELRVLWIVKELGLASIEEIEDRYKEVFEEEFEHANLVVSRWKARKAFAVENGRYKIASIPPWFLSLRMDQLIQLGKQESKEMLANLEELFTSDAPVGGGRRPVWRKFVRLEMTFENLDPILGGRPDESVLQGKKKKEAARTVFPREGDQLVVPMSWLKGWTRDNQSLMNVVGLQHHVAWAKGYWQGDIDTITKTAPVTARGKGVGVAQYEAIPTGNKFIVIVRWPMHGCAINSIEKIKEWCSAVEETPINGLGANAKAYGGRIRLVKVKEFD